MKNNLYISFIILFLTACSAEKNKEAPIVKENGSDDELVVYFDSIGSHQPKKIDSTLRYVERSNLWFKKPLNYDTQSEPLNNEEYPLKKVDRLYYPLDSVAIIHKDYKDPIIQPVIIKKHQVSEPNRIAVQAPRPRDNSVIDAFCIGPSEGLPTKMINDILIDSRGLFWLAAPNGLIRYEESHVKHFTKEEGLPDEALTCLEEDSEGNIWMGSAKNGVIKYDGKEFHHYRFDSILPNREISDIAFDHQGNLWCSVIFGGIVKIEGDEYTLYNNRQGIIDHRPLNHIEVDKNNQIFASGFGIGMYAVKNDSLYLYPRPLTTYNHSLLTNDDGSILITPFARHFSELKNDSLYNYHFDLKPEYGFIKPLKDSLENYWLSPVYDGLVQWDEKILKHYSKENGFPSNKISCITQQGKNLWVGTTDQGFFKFSPYSFKFLTEKDGLSDRLVYKIAEGKDGQYYLGTAKGFVELNDTIRTTFKNDIFTIQKNKKIFYKNGYYNEFQLNGTVLDFETDTSGFLMLVTVNKGVLYLDRNKGEISILGSNIKNGPANPSSITRTKDGIIWVSSSAGGHFYKIEKDSMKWYGTDHNLYARNINHLITNYNDEVCMGTQSYGVIIMNNQETFTYYNREDGLPSTNVKYLYEDVEKTLWACTPKGLAYKVKGKNEFKKINLPKYIPSENISAIIQDDQKRYWITTSDGLLMVKFNEDLKPEYHELFTKKKGLINSSFIDGSIFIDSKNQLMAGTNGGLMVFDLNDYEYQQDLPDVFIENIEINGKFIDFRKEQDFTYDKVPAFLNIPENLTLSHTQNHLTFNLAGKIRDDFQKFNYEYKLDGFDKHWNKTVDVHFVEYKNLDYGKYTFNYRAILPDGSQGEVQSYSFEIIRPWWHTWWARAFYALFIFILILVLIKWRTAKLKHRQKELEIEVDKATKEIREQKETIEVAHNEIKDSINYARRIQSAILPPEKVVKEYLENSFVWYQPKDVVAGDFYWMQSTDEALLIAVADCTGHGVPGAMVSVVCNNSLNRAVREFKLRKPSDILDTTRDLVIEEFEKSEEDVKDGMDISLIALLNKPSEGSQPSEGLKVSYAGANNPLWIIRKDVEQKEDHEFLREGDYVLIEIKADKQPIGNYEQMAPFTNNEIELLPGDTLYIFTDGFPDQFGGDDMGVNKKGGKKFKSKNFKKLLLSLQELTMEDQKKSLEKAFDQWKGDMEQVDDVCIIGVKIK